MTETTQGVFRPVPATSHARLWFFILLAVLGLPLLWLLFTLLRAPEIAYRIDNGVLTISSTLGSSHQEKTIALARVGQVRSEWLHGGALRFGTEKPGYCVGFFAYPGIGEVWQVTDCSEDGVLISAASEATPVVVTPGDRDAFVKALWSDTRAAFHPPGKRTGSWWFTLFSVVAVLLGVVLGLATVFIVAPARLRYAVAGGAVEVRTLLSSRRIPLAGVRARVHRPLLGARLSGVAIPGYVVGSWLLDTMATTVLASVREAGVLLEGEGRFFLSPQDGEAFLAAIEAQGATLAGPAEAQRRR
jgi:Bacterial PH domain